MKFQGPIDKWPNEHEARFTMNQLTLGILIAFASGAAVAMALYALL